MISPPLAGKFAELRKAIMDASAEAAKGGQNNRKQFGEALKALAAEIAELTRRTDAIKMPDAVFDPGNPETVGMFVALALACQPKRSLGDIHDFYGAGVYAVYYVGAFAAYAPVSGTETPVYVGQAITSTARGTDLVKRLLEHRKNIERATGSIDASGFEYRALVVQRGWESGAENFLINLFKPIWNKQTKILYGFGKHGDSSDTRRNKRSPWDTLHPGRAWAAKGEAGNAKDKAEILRLLKMHFEAHPPIQTFDDILRAFKATLAQT